MQNLFNTIVSVDLTLAQNLYSIRNPISDKFFLVFTYLGEWLVIIACLVILYLIVRKYHASFVAGYCALGVFLTAISSLILKALVGRDRPAADIALYKENLSSFPSAHSALIFVFWGFLVYSVWRTSHHISTKILFTLVSLFIILLVGFSRLYLGVHFLSDVLGGYLLALLWLLVVMYSSRRYF